MSAPSNTPLLPGEDTEPSRRAFLQWTGFGIAASAHLAAAIPHAPYIEFLPAELCDSALRRELVEDELTFVDGKIPLPTKPGLGIEINQEALKQYRVP